MTARIAVAAVTFDRPKELAVLLDSIKAQTAAVDTICLVDSGTTPARSVTRHSRFTSGEPEAAGSR